MKDTHFELPEDKLDRSVTMMARTEDQLTVSSFGQPTAKDRHSLPFYSGVRSLFDRRELWACAANVAKRRNSKWQPSASG